MMQIITKAHLPFPYTSTPWFLPFQGKKKKTKKTRQHRREPAEDRSADKEVWPELWLNSFATGLLPGHGAAVKTHFPIGKAPHEARVEMPIQPQSNSSQPQPQTLQGQLSYIVVVFPQNSL